VARRDSLTGVGNIAERAGRNRIAGDELSAAMQRPELASAG